MCACVCVCLPLTLVPTTYPSQSYRRDKLWIAMEFCGGGSLQDIYHGMMGCGHGMMGCGHFMMGCGHGMMGCGHGMMDVWSW